MDDALTGQRKSGEEGNVGKKGRKEEDGRSVDGFQFWGFRVFSLILSLCSLIYKKLKKVHQLSAVSHFGP